jgi:hypothetical protein
MQIRITWALFFVIFLGFASCGKKETQSKEIGCSIYSSRDVELSRLNKWSASDFHNQVEYCAAGAEIEKEADCRNRQSILVYCGCIYNRTGETYTYSYYQNNAAAVDAEMSRYEQQCLEEAGV